MTDAKQDQTVELLDDEKLIWTGHPSQYINLDVYVLCASILLGLPLIGSVIMWFANDALGSWGKFLFYIIALGILLPTLYALWIWIETRNIKYTLTSQRFRLRTGVFNRQTRELELYRVKDIVMEEPFHLRIASLGNIVMSTSDKSLPKVIIEAVSDSDWLKNQIRGHVESLRDKKSVREIDGF